MDSFDRAILAVLAQDGRISWKDLAQQIGLSETPTVRRVKALEARGVIDGYSARINEAAAGRPISVFVSVSMDRQNQPELNTFEAAIADSPLILSCFMLAGDVDYLLRVAVADIAEFQRFLDEVLRPIPGMRTISSSFALKPVIQRSLSVG
ncbi:Lrp/AsnC family transcriptional regulator [Sphingosinicella rhizophila]|uniref:Lrp/AsnC family transcriptional regulator n=1 Tax=Sphingosinicella rhizophila TaxID=3050082 RepID=A0ABU3QB72_9SPHN|nr:Lrp/AsnC family transcriptional regulator [Sphingosinicella sp. GR2756]MDT9600268.1 Lrp/AsnC family transcriptional regulator [Sphingosinicella sp. GR2756]